MRLSILIVLLALFVLAVPAAGAKAAHMRLLAVNEGGGNLTGSVADLYIEMKKGKGRVFLETYPLSKMDTQISTRFAKEIACKELDIDCGSYDFIYTIKAESSIIGGPSAGAAAALITMAALKGWDVDELATITGTINSGGLVGPVGGLKQKISAGAEAGLKVIMIPAGEGILHEELNGTNMTTNMTEYGREKGVNVIEIGNVREAVPILTGEKMAEEQEILVVDEEYKSIMRYVAEDLCGRTRMLRQEFKDSDIRINMTSDMTGREETALNLTVKANESLYAANHYSAASYCFGANIHYRYLAIAVKNTSADELNDIAGELMGRIREFRDSVGNRQLKTISDLQTYMIVEERLREAEKYVEEGTKRLNDSAGMYNIAFAAERLKSADSWTNFFDMEGAEYEFDDIFLEKSCMAKISEAEERLQYARFYLPGLLGNTRDGIDRARAERDNANFANCLFLASKAKAEGNIVLSSIGVEKTKIDLLVERKLDAAEKAIAREISKGRFPIMGYSYYEYADSLDEDKPSALLYSEYALELSNLDIYFMPRENFTMPGIDIRLIVVFGVGIIAGFAAYMVIARRRRKLTLKKIAERAKTVRKRR